MMLRLQDITVLETLVDQRAINAHQYLAERISNMSNI